MTEYNPDYYEYVLETLQLMYEGYEDYYWDLVLSLEPYELILFFEQVQFILTHPRTQPTLTPAGDTSL